MTDELLFIPDSSTDWDLITDTTKVASQQQGNAHIPIAAWDLGVLSNAEIFAILVNSSNAKQSWRWAGTITRLFPFQPNVDTSPIGKASTREDSLQLNRAAVIRFERLSPLSFTFFYHPPKWFKDVRIRVWEFIGETYNPRQEQLDRIENAVTSP